MRVREPRRPPEPDDAGNLRDTVESPGFTLLVSRLKQQCHDYVAALMVAKSWEEVRFIQGQIDALNRVIETPKFLYTELTRKAGKT